MFKLIGASAALLLVLLVGSAQPALAHTVDDDGNANCPSGHKLKAVKIVGSDHDKNANGQVCVDANAPTAVITANGEGALTVDGVAKGMAMVSGNMRILGDGSVMGFFSVKGSDTKIELDCRSTGACTGTRTTACYGTDDNVICTDSASVQGPCELGFHFFLLCDCRFDESSDSFEVRVDDHSASGLLEHGNIQIH